MTLPSTPVEQAYNEWATQGRTDEQKWAVRNFITGSLAKYEKQTLSSASKSLIDELDLTFQTDLTPEQLIKWNKFKGGIDYDK